MNVIKSFLEIFKTFDSHQVHNMLALMVDSYFKSLRVVERFMGCGNAIHFTIEYDVKEVIPLYMIVFD